jgi:hypothetical protein
MTPSSSTASVVPTPPAAASSSFGTGPPGTSIHPSYASAQSSRSSSSRFAAPDMAAAAARGTAEEARDRRVVTSARVTAAARNAPRAAGEDAEARGETGEAEDAEA